MARPTLVGSTTVAITPSEAASRPSPIHTGRICVALRYEKTWNEESDPETTAVEYDTNVEVDWVIAGYEGVYIAGYGLEDNIEPSDFGVTDSKFDMSDSSSEGVSERAVPEAVSDHTWL